VGSGVRPTSPVGTVVVGLTGATGHIGGRLLARLLADPQVAEVRSVARRPLAAQKAPQGDGCGRLVHVCADIRSEAARRALEGADLVYHLGAQVWRGKGPGAGAEMYAVNVEGTRNVLLAGSPVVVASSAAVYGAWCGNPLPLGEEHTARPNAECAYARHKLVAENVCHAEGGRWVIARLAAVLGPHADARVARAVNGYRLAVPAVRGAEQAVQWLDEDDAVEGLLAAGRDLTGEGRATGEVVNLATQDWLSAQDTARLASSRVVALPRRALVAASELGRRSGLSPFGADRACLIGGPLALCTDKASRLIGWNPRRTSAGVLADALARSWRQSPYNRRL